MNESSSLNASKDSTRSLCELSIDDFAKIKETVTFVDKTLFIKCVLSDTRKIVLLTAPRAFGKSTLMNMLKQFLLGKSSLFQNLKICTEEGRFFSKHCKPHPVIHIALGCVRGSSFADVKYKLAEAVNNAFQEHAYLVKKTDDGTRVWASERLNFADISVEDFEEFYVKRKCVTLSEAQLGGSLNFLSKVLHTHYEQNVFLLIDEYDAPVVGLIFESCSSEENIKLINGCLKRFMINTVRFNKLIERSLIFACVRLAGASSGDAERLIKHYPFLSDVRYAPYLGFTDAEVRQLLELPQIKAACSKVTFEAIEKWYDGYVVSNCELKIFSSWSVLNVLEEVASSGTLEYASFWIDTGYVKNLEQLFAEPSVRERIEEIISCGEVKVRTVKSVNIEHLTSLKELISLEFDEISEETVELFLEFLADCGYFNILSVDEKKHEVITGTEDENKEEETEDENTEEETEDENTGEYCILKIPNFEIKRYIFHTCYSEALTIRDEYNLSPKYIARYLNALQLVLESTSESTFVDLANAVLVLFSQPSQRRITNESELHHILHTLVYDSRYFVTHSEVQIKKIRKSPGIANTLDMVIIFKEIGIIFEYKLDSKSAQEALKQIFENRYHTKFDESDYGYISKKIYAGLAFNTKEKRVSITYQVGNETQSNSVCSDKL